jgi:hypothetical protein
MLIFLWVLGSLGVAWAAKVARRNPAWWFILSIALTPLIGSVALTMANRYRWRR